MVLPLTQQEPPQCSGASYHIEFPQQCKRCCPHLQMAKLRLGEAKSPWCLSPSGKQYLPLSLLFPKAGRPREEVKTTAVGVLLCALIVLPSLLGMGVSRALWPDLSA